MERKDKENMPLNDFDAYMMQVFGKENPEYTGDEDVFEREFVEWCNSLDYEEICTYVGEYIESLKETK